MARIMALDQAGRKTDATVGGTHGLEGADYGRLIPTRHETVQLLIKIQFAAPCAGAGFRRVKAPT